MTSCFNNKQLPVFVICMLRLFCLHMHISYNYRHKQKRQELYLRRTTRNLTRLSISIFLEKSCWNGIACKCRERVHDDVVKWKHFPRYWPFVRGIHRSPVNSTHKGQWRGALMLSLICVWTNGWVNNRDAGYLRRYRAHYDVTVMSCCTPENTQSQLLANAFL